MTQTPASDLHFRADPLTGFGSYEKLIADLRVALEPESPSSVLAIFDLAGSKAYRRLCGEASGDVLIVRLAAEFARVVRPCGACYRASEEHFAALVELPFEVSPVLEAAVRAIRAEGEVCLVTTSYGICLLPDDAGDPSEAIEAASHELDVAKGTRERREPPA